MDEVLRAVRTHGIKTVDITGGAPELNPAPEHISSPRPAAPGPTSSSGPTSPFSWSPAWRTSRNSTGIMGSRWWHRCRTLPGQASSRVRGEGAFEKSLQRPQTSQRSRIREGGTDFALNLVYNPPGAASAGITEGTRGPLPQDACTPRGIAFNSLYTFANMALGRFREFLDSGPGASTATWPRCGRRSTPQPSKGSCAATS